jgi:hypothetical protein
MKKSIYDVYVTVTSQEQADRLKGICLEYGLPIWLAEVAFDYYDYIDNIFMYSSRDKGFAVYGANLGKTPITESEFEQLAKKFK